MTPNRKLRTTAIAALVAVSTVFAGVTPAIAVPTNTTNSTVNPVENAAAGLNIADGSKLPKGFVKSEEDLQTATNSVGKAITEYGTEQDTAALGAVFAAHGNPNALVGNEFGALDALTAELKKVSATLATAAQNQANAQASVQAALEADQAADAAWTDVIKKLADLSQAQRTAVNKLVKAVNDENKTGKADIPLLPEGKDEHVTPEQAVDFIVALATHDNNVNLLTADQTADHYVSRQYLAALEKLLEDKTVASFYEAFKAARPAILESQRHDIITLQMFLDRSRAQVQVLRIVEANYAVAVRLIELYENNPSKNNQTAADAYLAFVNGAAGRNMLARQKEEQKQLAAADAAADALFKGWNNDLANGVNVGTKEDPMDAEEKAYEQYRDSEAKLIYANIVADREWQNELNRAQNADRDIFLAKADAAAAKAADAKAAQTAKATSDAVKKLSDAVADQAKQSAETQGALKDIAKKLGDLKPAPAPAPKPSETPKPTPAPSHDDFPIVPIAIVGVVLAALAALAAHFPVIAGMLPKI